MIKKMLMYDPRERPTALELLDDIWLERNLDSQIIEQQVQLDIANNLEEFKATTTFQSGVLSFMINLKSTSKELEELNKMFLLLDTSKDGILSVQEIKQGLDSVLGQLKGNAEDYRQLVSALDRDGNGVIDYQEFITASIDKMALVNQENLT
jgi:calcium-dependent protein kinase